ncbi:hypothetical protein ABZ934_16325 [Streptomyces sp. NPDC046557]|uniref:D-alanyl-D-alanine carboxypeptidase family protein n=1 Tax=Streptomyces sp. NPDC046557 TaxID=3155372 RepID=UPI0034026753
MAGESPDKSVDEGASGTAESAAPSAERDPRLSVLRPREAGSGDRDALKEAVAAWVATSASGGSGDAEPDVGAGADAEAPADRRPAEAEDAKPGSASAEDQPECAADAEERDSAKVSRPAEQEKAAFGVVKSGAASGAGSADRRSAASEDEKPKGDASKAPAEEPRTAAPTKSAAADSERTAVFRAVKPDTAAPEKKPAVPEKPAGADSERTAVFRTVKPERAADAEERDSAKVSRPAEPEKTAFGVVKSGAAAGAGSTDRRSAASEDEKPKGAASKAPAEEPRTAAPTKSAAADSERTAVFRAVKPDTAAPEKKPAVPEKPASAASEKKPSGDPRNASGKPAAADSGVDSERTAVFRAVKPDTAAPEKKPTAPEDSERTAVFRTVKPDTAAPEKKPAVPEKPASAASEKKPSGDPRNAPGKPAAADSGVDSERTAVFRAVKADTAAPEKKSAAPGPQGRGSTFVPLGGNGPKPPAPASAPRPTPQPTRPQPSPDAERTTQQPLPPKPPLDMLADLTNNPPPPPTPLRTALRRVKIYAPIVVLLAVVLAVVQLVRPLPAPRLALSAKSSYTFDGGAPTLPWPKEGQGFMAAAGLGTVGTFGEQKPIPIGSVAKTMTAYVILKNHPMKPKEQGPAIDVDKTAVDDGRKVSENESTVNTLKEGDKISEHDALAAIMIPSANNVARLLARWDTAGDQAAFVKKMNDAARELGMTNTTYTDPSGLDPTTVSTAEDQVKLGLKVVEMPELIAITKLPSWTDPYGKSWRNWNDLIPGNGALGIKTGSTTKAGGNLLFAAEKKVGKTKQLIVGAVLGQYGPTPLDNSIAASKQVMIATQNALTNATLVKKGDVVGYVDDGLGGHTPVIATADVEAVGWPSLTVTVKLGDGGAKLPETAKEGTEVGVLTVGEGASQVKVPVALQRDLVAPGIGSKLTRVG